MMRSKKALINALVAMCSYAVLVLSNFVIRGVFQRKLGLDMVGLDTLFKNFISMLALAELGLGTGLIYKLYKPISEKDNVSIKHILNFYKKAYQVISIVIVTIGFCISFLIHYLIKEDISPYFIGLVFFLYVGDVISSYLYANRKALFIADQKNFIVSMNDASVQLMAMVAQVSLLYITQSFIVYASVKIVCRLLGAILIGRKFKKHYPEIADDKDKTIISGEERRSLLRNISAMLCHKVGGFSIMATGSAIIAFFVDLTSAGIYGNYTMITFTLGQFITQMFNGITASFGNLLSTETKEKVYERFNVLYLLSFLIYSFCTVSIFLIIQPFITLWVGEESLFPVRTLILMVAYFYVLGIRRVIIMSKDSAGLFRPDRYLALLEAALNIVLALILVQKMGVDGVVLASVLSMLLIPLWSQPYLVYKYILGHPLRDYYIRYVIYFLCTALELFVTVKAASLLTINNVWLQLLFRGVLCLIIPNTINLLLFYRTKEFRLLLDILKSIYRSSSNKSNDI